MKMEMYVAPELEVLEVIVESGFAASSTPGGAPDSDFGGGTSPF